MAIGARISPELIVLGIVTEVRARNWEGKYSGMRATVETNGGPILVGFRPEADDDVPAAGDSTALVASVYEGPNGATLSFIRRLSPGDLDSLVSASGLALVSGK